MMNTARSRKPHGKIKQSRKGHKINAVKCIQLLLKQSQKGRKWGESEMYSTVDRICGVWLSLCVGRLVSRRSSCLASACICLACVLRLSASVHVKGFECVCLASVRLLASVCVGRLVSHLSRVCLRRSSCLASVSRLSASVVLSRVCLASVVLSRICLASVSRRSSCLASVSRRSSCLASVSRRSSCLASVSRLSL